MGLKVQHFDMEPYLFMGQEFPGNLKVPEKPPGQVLKPPDLQGMILFQGFFHKAGSYQGGDNVAGNRGVHIAFPFGEGRLMGHPGRTGNFKFSFRTGSNHPVLFRAYIDKFSP
jgi:hypothetical protein